MAAAFDSRVNNEGREHFVEYRVVHPDGAVRWLRDRAYPLLNERGEVYRVLGVAEDVTARKEAEGALVEQRELYEVMLGALPVEVVLFDAQHRYLFCNPTAISNDETREWLIGKDDFDYCAYRGLDMAIAQTRRAHFDVLVGINLLREGLDLPEVSLVAILDADKTGFLRSERSLIQTIGRAARNVKGEVFLYADVVSDAMRAAIDETERRREKQLAYNEKHGVTPETIRKRIHDVIRGESEGEEAEVKLDPWERELVMDDVKQELGILEAEMWQASEDLDFERAAAIRDRIRELEARLQGKEIKMATVPGGKPQKPKAEAALSPYPYSFPPLAAKYAAGDKTSTPPMR